MTITPNVAKQKLQAGELVVGFGMRSMRTTEVAKIAKNFNQGGC